MAGYTFKPGKDFTIVPKLGFSMWELTVFDSNLFNIFGESEEFSYDGTDMVLSVEGEYSMTDLIQLNLSFNQGSYDFGDVSSYHFGVELDF
jgi:hypothetical protein